MGVLTTGAPPRASLRYQLDTGLGRLTPAERAERGKAARVAVPRDSHAEFDPGPDRPDPLVLLEEQAKARVPELVPVRWGRMMVSPFTFYRGAALPMASDLATTPVSGLAVQACGDAHLSNFGIFGSAERRLVFDVNDFDETLPGPWEWDVKRLAASLEVAGRDNGFAGKDRRAIVTATVASYRQAMRNFAGMTNLDVWYAHADVDQVRADFDAQLKARQRKVIDQGIAKARTRDSMQEVAKLCRVVDGQPRIIADAPLLVPIADLLPAHTDRAAFAAQIKDLLGKYRRTLETDRRFLLETFEFADMARKVVGVGSVGTRCWIVLMLGRDESDPLFLQVKEAEASVLSRFVGASKYTNQGQRVVAGQRLMQAASDIFLGWQRDRGRPGQPAPRLLRPPAAGLEVLHAHRDHGAARHAGLRPAVRMDAGAGARPLRRPDRHRRLPRQLRRVRPGHHPVRRRLRRPERARPQIARGRRGLGTDHRRTRPVRSRHRPEELSGRVHPRPIVDVSQDGTMQRLSRMRPDRASTTTGSTSPARGSSCSAGSPGAGRPGDDGHARAHRGPSVVVVRGDDGAFDLLIGDAPTRRGCTPNRTGEQLPPGQASDVPAWRDTVRRIHSLRPDRAHFCHHTDIVHS